MRNDPIEQCRFSWLRLLCAHASVVSTLREMRDKKQSAATSNANAQFQGEPNAKTGQPPRGYQINSFRDRVRLETIFNTRLKRAI